MKYFIILSIGLLLAGCSSNDRKSLLVNSGDTKNDVSSAMGMPDNRQIKGDNEAWQYCESGAGFNHHDYLVIWFYKGSVTGVNSYKKYTRKASACGRSIRQINWKDAPNVPVQISNLQTI